MRTYRRMSPPRRHLDPGPIVPLFADHVAARLADEVELAVVILDHLLALHHVMIWVDDLRKLPEALYDLVFQGVLRNPQDKPGGAVFFGRYLRFLPMVVMIMDVHHLI